MEVLIDPEVNPEYYDINESLWTWYHNELSNITGDTNVLVLSVANERFLKNLLIEEIHSKGEGDSEKVIASTYWDYMEEGTSIVLENLYENRSEKLKSAFIESGINSEGKFGFDTSYLKTKYNMVYNDQENLVEYTREDGVTVAMVNKDGNYLLEAVNATYEDVKSYDGSNGETLRGSLQDAMITTRKMDDKGHVIQETDANGKNTYYLYSGDDLIAVKNHEKQLVKIMNSYSATNENPTIAREIENDPDLAGNIHERIKLSDFGELGRTHYDKSFSLSKYVPYVKYHIGFGDGQEAEYTDKSMSHTYTQPGNYTCSIKAYLENGTLVDEYTKDVEITASDIIVEEVEAFDEQLKEGMVCYGGIHVPLVIKGGVGVRSAKLKYYYVSDNVNFAPQAQNSEKDFIYSEGQFYCPLFEPGYYTTISVEVTDEQGMVSKTLYSGYDGSKFYGIRISN